MVELNLVWELALKPLIQACQTKLIVSLLQKHNPHGNVMYIWVGHPKLHMGFLGGTSDKELSCQCRRHRDAGSIPLWGRSPREVHGYPLQYPCLENPHGQRNLVGYCPLCHTESDMTEAT